MMATDTASPRQSWWVAVPSRSSSTKVTSPSRLLAPQPVFRAARKNLCWSGVPRSMISPPRQSSPREIGSSRERSSTTSRGSAPES